MVRVNYKTSYWCKFYEHSFPIEKAIINENGITLCPVHGQRARTKALPYKNAQKLIEKVRY